MPIFISYSHKDSEFAEKLAIDLVANNARVWIDKWELKVGDSIINKIQNAVAEASALLVILSKSSVTSEWCKKELSAGLIRELDEKRVIVLPVLIEDCAVPMFLQDKKYADFRRNYEEGFHEIVAGIASVTSDSLGRLELSGTFVDWSVDWKEEKGIFQIEITMIELAAAQPYTILTTAVLTGDKIATKLHRKYEAAGIGWFHRIVLICEFARIVSQQEKSWFRLRDEHPQQAKFIVDDPKIGMRLKAHVTSRRLGKDTGNDLLVNMAGQLNGISDTLLKTSRQLTAEEFNKMLVLRADLDR